MKDKELPKGVTIRKNSIQIAFTLDGEQCRHSLKIKPTDKNIIYASNKLNSIKFDIEINKFDYEKHFPKSRASKAIKKGAPKTIKDALLLFLENKKTTCEHSTFHGYNNCVNNILIKEFGNLLLKEINEEHIINWIGKLNCSRKTVTNNLIPMRSILMHAAKKRWIDSDPMAYVPIIKEFKNLNKRKPEEVPDPFSPQEIHDILKAAEEGPIRNLFKFAFSTGLRTSELIALSWDDIDFNKNEATIRKAYVLKKMKCTKTPSGERTIKLNSHALNALEDQKKYKISGLDNVFYNENKGLHWAGDYEIRRVWKKILSEAGVRYRYPYQTRHTYASLSISSGEKEIFVAHQMGHRDVTVIRQSYAKWVSETDPHAGSKLDSALSNIGKYN